MGGGVSFCETGSVEKGFICLFMVVCKFCFFRMWEMMLVGVVKKEEESYRKPNMERTAARVWISVSM